MQPKEYFLVDLALEIERSMEMKHQQTYRGSSFYFGWMRGTLVYDDSLSPSLFPCMFLFWKVQFICPTSDFIVLCSYVLVGLMSLSMPTPLGDWWFTRVASPKSQVTFGESMQYQLLRAWKVGLTTSSGIPNPRS